MSVCTDADLEMFNSATRLESLLSHLISKVDLNSSALMYLN